MIETYTYSMSSQKKSSDWPQLVTVYAIEHRDSGKAYVGSTKQYETRKYEHIKNLLAGTHHSPMLQNAWDKYGEKMFEFKVLEERACLSPKDRVEFEVSWVLSKGSFNARFPTVDNTGFSMSNEGKKRISTRNKERWNDPVQRKQWIEANTLPWKDPSKKEARVEKMRKHLEDPEVYNARCKASSSAWSMERRNLQSTKLKTSNPGEIGRNKRWSKEGAREDYSNKMRDFWSDPIRKAAAIEKRRVTVLRKKNLTVISTSKESLLRLLQQLTSNTGI